MRLAHRGAAISEAALAPAEASSWARSAPLVPSAHTAGAMPLASVDPDTSALTLYTPALEALAALPAPMCVLSVAGAAHEGKSTVLNMLSHWLTERWETVNGAGADFRVGSLFERGTDGAWLRTFVGRNGAVLPGTECRSLALIDVAGVARALSLDGAGTPTADLATSRLLTLSLLASSSVTLNLMAPVLNNLHQLALPLAHAKRVLSAGWAELTLADLPSLVVLGRDAPPKPHDATADSTDSANAESLAAAQLEYALLMPRGDSLDATKRHLRALFPLERTVTNLAMPDARDLDAISRNGLPPAYTIPGLPLSGTRPFYASFDAAASATLAALRPKSVGGYHLPGAALAHALASLVDTINRDAPSSLQKAVYATLSAQANEAVAKGVQSGIDELRTALLPILSQLPAAPATHQTADAPPADTPAAAPHAANTHAATSSLDDEPRSAPADGGPMRHLTAEVLEETLRNATERAYATFAHAAPSFGADEGGEVAAWLRPYATAVLSEMWGIEREARAAMAQAHRLEEAIEARVATRVRERVDASVRSRLAAALASHEGGLMHQRAHPNRRRRLLSSLALVAVGAGASTCVTHAALLTKLAPLGAALMQLTPFMGGPALVALLALLGAYRVLASASPWLAQPLLPLRRAVDSALGGVRAAARGARRAAVRAARVVPAAWRAMWFGRAHAAAA